MNIYEKDIFDFVWQPHEMDIKIYRTIKENYSEYKDKLKMIKALLNSQKVAVNIDLLEKIKVKIREKENIERFKQNGNFKL